MSHFPVHATPRYRTLFLSDLHLGHFGARSDYVIQFLHRNIAENYVLVGDILDLWIPKSPAWSLYESEVIAFLTKRHAQGAGMTYITGNHDRHPRRAPPAMKLPVDPVAFAVHEAADGRRYLVIHGDGHDTALFTSPATARVGHKIEQALWNVETAIRTIAGVPKAREHRAVDYLVSSFNKWRTPAKSHERRLVAEAKAHGLDGVICGHFHQPALLEIEDAVYANCGDWLQSFTAVAECEDGHLNLLKANPSHVAVPLRSEPDNQPVPVPGSAQTA